MFRQFRRLSMEPGARRAGLLLVVIIGVALRVYRLDAQSFWYDEGNSARIAERSLQLIIAGAAGDIHPPLYYIVLHYWRAAFGDTEFMLRMLSVLCGVGLVIFTYLLARRLFSSRVGLIASALVAFSPFAVYYSQEARMYAMLAFEAVVSTWALTRILDSRLTIDDSTPAAWRLATINRESSILVYVLSTAAGLYTQYAYPFVMLGQGAAVLLWLAGAEGKRLRALAIYAAVNVAAIALFAPWLPIAVRQVTSWSVT
ncbi:MAG TPA: glycosyltransferase family 39 protein, partial [Anaerolineae bacterium]